MFSYVWFVVRFVGVLVVVYYCSLVCWCLCLFAQIVYLLCFILLDLFVIVLLINNVGRFIATVLILVFCLMCLCDFS